MLVLLRVLLVTFACYSHFVGAVAWPMDKTLDSLEDKINREPWQSYQKIQMLAKNYQQYSKNNKLLFLLRKAQAENLLYFYPKFEQTVAKAQSLITTDTPIEIVIEFNIYSGLIFERSGTYSKAADILSIALKQARENKLSYLAVLAKQELAYTRSLTELFEASLTEVQEAYVEAFALNDDFLIAVINEVYGAMYTYMKQYEKSVEYYQKALQSYEQLGYRAHVAEAVYGLATAYRYWKKYDLAIEKFSLYRNIVNYTPNKDITFFGAYGLGMTLAEQGKCVEGIKVIDQALKLNGIKDYNAELLKRKAECLIEQDKLSQAQESINAASAIFDKIKELQGTSWQLEVIKIKAHIAHAQGQYARAYFLLNDYYQKHDALAEKNNENRLIQVRSALELERKNIETSLLEQVTKIQQLKIDQQRHENKQQSYIISIAVIVVIFVLFIVLLQYNSKKKVIALSVRDPLSNLYNRRYIFDFLSRLVKSANVDKADVSVMLIDIDDFKKINDQYGHPFGDEVIRTLADIGQETLRVGDMMGRVGGEEFICVLPRTDSQQCLKIARRLLENINSHVFYSQGNNIRITLSIGVATLSSNINDALSLYTCADKALYYVKNHGKNNVVEYREHMMYTYQESNTQSLSTDEFS